MTLLILFLRLKDRLFLELLLLVTFLLSIKLWLWELFKQKELLLSKNHLKMKIKVSEQLPLGVWDRWEDTPQIMQKH